MMIRANTFPTDTMLMYALRRKNTIPSIFKTWKSIFYNSNKCGIFIKNIVGRRCKERFLLDLGSWLVRAAGNSRF